MTQDVIIIGAPRSGTNMLRDVLTSLPGFTTWPCDEINLIWRHGNRKSESDELSQEMARPEVCHYLHRQFAKLGEKFQADTVVEKTCANSLRVEFVAQAFPHAKYLFIHRNGLDAAASAMRRWNADFDLKYTIAKARYAPPADLPFYAAKMVMSQLTQRGKESVADEQSVDSWWGPKMHDFQDLQQNHSLEELCMIQWQRCVETSLRGLSKLPSNQVLHVGYEQFVNSPVNQLSGILEFLNKPDSFDENAVRRVTNTSVGQGRRSLGAETYERLGNLAAGAMERFGYA